VTALVVGWSAFCISTCFRCFRDVNNWANSLPLQLLCWLGKRASTGRTRTEIINSDGVKLELGLLVIFVPRWSNSPGPDLCLVAGSGHRPIGSFQLLCFSVASNLSSFTCVSNHFILLISSPARLLSLCPCRLHCTARFPAFAITSSQRVCPSQFNFLPNKVRLLC